MALSKFEKFVPTQVHRSALKNAPYNPRVMTDRARKLLKENLEKVGLVEPPIWNKRTGNLVGGHQRLAALDALEGTGDYTLTVAQVDLDAKTEKEQNVFLNNPNAQGDWDLEALEKMLADDVNLENSGFSQSEIYQLFGDAALANSSELTQALSDQIQQTQEQYLKIANAKAKGLDSDDFFAMLIFKNNAQREEFAKLIGEEDNRYLNGEELIATLRKILPTPAAETDSGDVEPTE
jgi:hypothetical protein